MLMQISNMSAAATVSHIPAHLTKELLFQTRHPAAVHIPMSSKVPQVCTLQRHLQYQAALSVISYCGQQSASTASAAVANT
jgi:hypothetical protein